MKFDLKLFQQEIIKKLNGNSLRKAAKEIGIDHQNLWNSINGREPRLNHFLKILEWLDKDFYYFVNKRS